jgi:ribosomal protein L44E
MGSTVTFQHIKSHAAASSTRTQHQVGNSIADRVAVFCRDSSELQRQQTAERGRHRNIHFSTPDLQLQQGERFVFAQQDGRFISADVRKALTNRCKALAVEQWKGKSSRSEFAGVEVKDLFRQVASESPVSKRRVRLVLAVTANSFQFYRQENKATKRVDILERECESCSVRHIADVAHVLTCEGRNSNLRREQLVHDVKACLSQMKHVSAWIVLCCVDLGLHDVIALFFSGGNATSVAPSLLLRWMFGGFSDREFRAAVQRLRCSADDNDLRFAVCSSLRLLLFDFVCRCICE